MSYIIRSGNLTATPVLRNNTETGAPYCFARVAVNDRAKDGEGRWQNVGTSFYDLTVSGDTAQRLVALAEESGNVRLVFAGRYVVREFKRKDGSTGSAHTVRVDALGVSLRGQDIHVTRSPNRTSELVEPEDEEWREFATF